MKDIDYAYAVSHIRAHESALISTSALFGLVSLNDVGQILEAIRQNGYNIEKYSDVNEMLNKKLNEAYELVYEAAPEKEELKLLTVRNDFNNLKAVLKAIVAGKEASDCYTFPTSVDIAELKRLLSEKKYSELDESMSYIAKKSYDILVRSMDAQRCDVCVDKFTLRAMQQISLELKSDIIKQYVEAFVAFTDIKTAFRCARTNKHRNFIYDSICGSADLPKEFLINAADKGEQELMDYLASSPYKEAAAKLAKSPQTFEKYADDALTDILKKAKLKAFGIEPLIAYYFAFETQTKCLRILTECKKNGVENKEITERMRELYV